MCIELIGLSCSLVVPTAEFYLFGLTTLLRLDLHEKKHVHKIPSVDFEMEHLSPAPERQ